MDNNIFQSTDLNPSQNLPPTVPTKPDLSLIKILLIIGLIIFILAVGLVSYILGQTSVKPTILIIPTVVPTVKQVASSSAETKNWKTYTDKTLGFTVKHPENVKPETYNDGTFILSLWGPKQTEDTEFFDGVLIEINKKPLSGKTLAEIVEENRAGSEEIAGEKVPPAFPVGLGGISGLAYTAMDNDYYFIPLKSGYYFEILNLSADPGKLGYLDTATKILKSLEIF